MSDPIGHAPSPSTVGVHELSLEVSIEAGPEAVWKALTADIGTWWPRSFHIGGDGATFHLEVRPGGRLYEDWGEGAGLLWGTVNTIEPGRLLRVASDSFPEYGGPARAFLTWRLEAHGDGTRVRFSEAMIGIGSPEQRASVETGWRFLLDCLRARLEGRAEPEWPSA